MTAALMRLAQAAQLSRPQLPLCSHRLLATRTNPRPPQLPLASHRLLAMVLHRLLVDSLAPPLRENLPLESEVPDYQERIVRSTGVLHGERSTPLHIWHMYIYIYYYNHTLFL